MKVLFNEICRKSQGKMAVIEAETVEEAIEKFGGVDEKISLIHNFLNTISVVCMK